MTDAKPTCTHPHWEIAAGVQFGKVRCRDCAATLWLTADLLRETVRDEFEKQRGAK